MLSWLPAPRSSSGRLSRADLGALTLLDQLLAEERALEQRYALPFRAPRQTATTIHQCQRCGQDLLFLIFADAAHDEAGLLAYGRLMAEPIRQTNLPAYALAPVDPAPPTEASRSLLMRLWPEPGAVQTITPPEFDQLLVVWSAAHCGGVGGGEQS